ncbi:MAG: sulfatase-like hydrolase/transferase [Reichenbachiella sp.]
MIHKYILQMVVVLLVCTSCYRSKESKKEKPNIIFLLSDDQRDNTFGAMGHSVLQTPNVDKLIEQGVRFSNTYIAEPVCAQSRISIFTGMHERLHGVGFTSSYDLTEEQWENSYPELLRKNGYYTGFIGKIGIEYYEFKGRVKEKFDFWKGHDGWAKFWPKTVEHCFEYFKANEQIITPIMGESIGEFIESVPKDKPFSLSVSFSVPHGSQVKSMYPNNKAAAKCAIAANEYDPLKGLEFYDTLYRNVEIKIPDETATDPYVNIPKNILDQSKGRATGTYIYDYDTAWCREHHVRYYQMISAMDRVIGDMMTSLEEKGLSENTIIIFASDHGLLMGEHGMGGKALLYDMASKIPFFIYDPRLPDSKKGLTKNELVSSLDITSTILDYAGIEPTVEMQGKSLLPIMNTESVEWREELFLESLFTGRDNPFCEGIRKGDWKYIRMYKGGIWGYTEENLNFKDRKPAFEQLFNVKDDPGERNNLINSYEETKLLSDLRTKTATLSAEMNRNRQEYKKRHTILARKIKNN